MEAYYTVKDRSARELDDDGQKYYHLVLLAQNNIGLHNLFKLSSRSFTEGFYHKPRIDDALLSEYSDGIIATSACLGSRASQLILRGRTAESERLLAHHSQIFSGRFLLEVQLHANKEQQTVNQELIRVGAKNGWPVVAANDCHYTKPDDKTLHEQTLCMQTGGLMSMPPWNPEAKGDGETKGPTRFSFGPIDVHVANTDFMVQGCIDNNIPLEAITNTRYVADMIDDQSYFTDIMNRYPKFRSVPDDSTAWQLLEHKVKVNLTKRFGGRPPEEYINRVYFELNVIKKMGFYDYLLIVNEFIEGAHSEGVWVGPGRGSAAGSLVAYALGITNVDPIKYGLLFERWLNYGRAATPVIFSADMIKQIDAMPTTHSHTCSADCKHDHH
jgi:DNA polymerase-3 subunit alpha